MAIGHVMTRGLLDAGGSLTICFVRFAKLEDSQWLIVIG